MAASPAAHVAAKAVIAAAAVPGPGAILRSWRTSAAPPKLTTMPGPSTATKRHAKRPFHRSRRVTFEGQSGSRQARLAVPEPRVGDVLVCANAPFEEVFDLLAALGLLHDPIGDTLDRQEAWRQGILEHARIAQQDQLVGDAVGILVAAHHQLVGVMRRG